MEMTDFNGTLKDVAEGATKGFVEGALNWTSKFIKELALKFRDNKLAFIQDEKTINIVKEQYRSGELAIYKEYIQDKEMLFLIKMGLTLRRLDKEKEEERRMNLRSKIFQKYKLRGLHIAQLVENGILNRYVGILIDDMTSINKFKEDLKEMLVNIDKYVLFVKKEDIERDVIRLTVNMTTLNLSMIFIISGIASAAQTVRKCESRLKELLKEY